VLPPDQSYREVLRPLGGAVTSAGSAVPVRRRGNDVRGLLWFLIDVVLWAVSLAIGYALLRAIGKGSTFPNVAVFLIPFVVSVIAAWMVGAYDQDTDFMSLRFSSESIMAGLMATLVGAGAAALFGTYGQGQTASRFLLLLTPALFTTANILSRRKLGGSAVAARPRMVLLGSAAEEQRLRQALSLMRREGTLVRIDPDAARSGSLEALIRESSPADADADPPVTNPLLGALILAPSAAAAATSCSPLLAGLHASWLPVYSWTAFWTQRLRMLDLEADSTDWLFEKDFRHLDTSVYWHLKRLFDIAVAATGLVLTAPLSLFAWIAIRLTSPGPAIFRQERVGLRGRPFTIYKFRTMHLNSEHEGTLTVPGDARITRLGKFLRRTRLDEIPQLVNILKGDMSVVGPRPEWTVCVRQYEDKVPCYHLRHLAKPGLTGWAQVNFPYGESVEDAAAKLSFDLFYVTHASLVLDCSIILKTLYVVMGRVGGR
jgi:exopolysaccharide biosynthesis polyprenyl glycosylphosphotransferase